jgi:hypothetical protein
MKGVEDRDHVRELVTDRIGVAPERVEGGMLHAGDERRVLALQPAGVGGPGPAGDHVQEASV